MTTKFAGMSRGGVSMAFTVVPFTKGVNPGAARAHAKRYKYGTTGGPHPGYYEAIQQARTGVDPRTPTPDETQAVTANLATADQTTTCVTVLQDAVVTSVTYTAPSNVTGANSPASRTLKLINTGSDNSGTAVIATLALTAGVNLVGTTPKTIPLGSDTAIAVGSGDVLKWVSTHVGATGLADPGGNVIIKFDEV